MESLTLFTATFDEIPAGRRGMNGSAQAKSATDPAPCPAHARILDQTLSGSLKTSRLPYEIQEKRVKISCYEIPDSRSRKFVLGLNPA
jgi:hypothetical protein